MAEKKTVYSLIPFEDFKGLLSVDDRDDALCRFCLTAATYSIEQYCKRRLLRKKHFERVPFYGDLVLPLKEYPVQKVLTVYAMSNEKLGMSNGELLEPEFYSVVPDCGTDEDIVYSLSLSPALKRYKNLIAIKAVYFAGYASGKVPADLVSACLELASWNINRYKGRRIGTTGNIRGSGKDGEHFESSMPENVKHLLEPYRRKLI